jgi:glucose/arabinose dehydrogenase
MRLFLFLCLLGVLACNAPNPSKGNDSATKSTPVLPRYSGKLPLDKIKLPPGFRIGVFAEGVSNARSLCLSPNGTLFVGTRDAGYVYALRDTNGDHVADLKYTLASGLRMPNGVAFRNGSLFVAEVSRILRFDDIENRLANPPAPVVVYDKYPTESHHGWKYIAFGPDGKLYVPVGAPCNICESEKPVYASMTRLDVDNPAKGHEVVQSGIRNTVGFTWHPVTKALWFTDNNRDMLGDNLPACELNHAPKDGMHFGYPYCHQGDLPDPEFTRRTVDGMTVDGRRWTVDGGRWTVRGTDGPPTGRPSTVHRPPYRPPSTVHRLPSTVHRLPSTVHRPPSTVHRPPSTVHRPPSTVHRRKVVQFPRSIAVGLVVQYLLSRF